MTPEQASYGIVLFDNYIKQDFLKISLQKNIKTVNSPYLENK